MPALKIEGQSYTLPVHFRASLEIAEHVADPLAVLADLARAHASGDHTQTLRVLSMRQVVDALIIGLRHAGCEHDDDALAEALMQQGLVTLAPLAIDYICSMVEGAPRPRGAGAKKPKATSRRTGKASSKAASR